MRADRLDQPVGDVHLVVERQLNRDDRQRVERRARLRLLVPVPHVEIHEVVAVPPVDCENDQDEEVGGERQRFSGRHGSSGQSMRLYITDRSTEVNELTVDEPIATSRRCSTQVAARRDRRGRRRTAGCSRRCGPSRSRIWASRASITIASIRQGFPEVVLGLGKTPAQIAAIAAEIVAARLDAAGDARQRGGVRRRARQSCPARRITPMQRIIAFRQQDVTPGQGHDPRRRRPAPPTCRSPRKRRARPS